MHYSDPLAREQDELKGAGQKATRRRLLSLPHWLAEWLPQRLRHLCMLPYLAAATSPTIARLHTAVDTQLTDQVQS